MMKWKLHVVRLVLLAVLALLPIGRAGAEPRHDIHGDLIHPGAEEYSGIFNGIGAVPAKDGEARLVLVNDRTYRVAEDAIFRSQSGGKTTLNTFKDGVSVKYYALDDLLTKMWAVKAEQGEKENAAGADKKTAPVDAVRLEGGKWKN